MSPTGTRGSVVVGIDGTRGAEAALDWATAEAAVRGCRLRIVHAFHPSLSLMSVVLDRRLIGWGRGAPSWVIGRVLWDC